MVQSELCAVVHGNLDLQSVRDITHSMNPSKRQSTFGSLLMKISRS